MFTLIFNLICYYIVWFVSILSAAHGYAWTGISVALGITCLQIILFKEPKKPLLIFMTLLTTCGWVIDTLLIHYGLLYCHANPFRLSLSPPWMLGLWLNFSFIVYSYLRPYFTNTWLMSLLSFFGFPIAYYAGVALGAAELPKGYVGLLVLSIVWSITLPTLLRLFAKRAPQSNI